MSLARESEDPFARAICLREPTELSECLPLAMENPRREDLGPDENLCDHCTAKCCHYFALPMDEPTTPQDFDFLRWFLLHDRASVFTEDETLVPAGSYAVQALAARQSLRHLRPAAPGLPRLHHGQCEYHDDWTYERYFETPEQVEEYAEAMFSERE